MAKNSPAKDVMDAIKAISSQLPPWVAILFVPACGIFAFVVLDRLIFGYFRRLSPQIDSSVPAFLALGAMVLAFVAVIAGQLERKQRAKQLTITSQTKDLTRMSWRDFERLVADAYRRTGHQVTERGGATPDGGVELELLTRDGRKGLVQCKQWKTRKVGVKIVREILGVLSKERANFAVIITCGNFTQEAITFATGQPIELINGQKLIQLVEVALGGRNALDGNGKALTSNLAVKACPKCGSNLVKRTARKGPKAGSKFYGCSGYPNCRHTENIR